MGRHKNKRLTPEIRKAIVQQYDKQPAWKQLQLAKWAAETFGLAAVPSQPTISIVLRQGGRFMGPARAGTGQAARAHKPKPVKCPELEAALVKWLELQIQKDVAITVSSVQTKAQELQSTLRITAEGFSVSDAWVDCFIRQHLLNCPFTSDSEGTDVEGAGKATKAELGKTELDAKTNARTPRPSSAKSTGKRKRENGSSEGSRQVRTRK